MYIGVIPELMRKPLNEALDYAGKVLKVEGVQIYASYGHDVAKGEIDLSGDCTDEELSALLAKCRENGLVISAICADGFPGSFQVESEAPARVAVTKKVIDNAAKLGVKVLTTHIGHIPDSPQDPVYPTMVKYIGEIARYAESKGCVLAIETGPELADVLKYFIEDVGSKGLGVNLDPANLRGVACEDPVYAVEILAPYIVHTHAKDSINVTVGSTARKYQLRNPDGSLRQIVSRSAKAKEVPLGQGMVPWDEYIAALKKIGYDGFLTIERECGEDPVGDIMMAVDFLKSKI